MNGGWPLFISQSASMERAWSVPVASGFNKEKEEEEEEEEEVADLKIRCGLRALMSMM